MAGKGIAGVIAAPFAVLAGGLRVFFASPALFMGAGLVYWWALYAPAGWPNYRLGGKVIGITLHLPTGPGAKLLAMIDAGKKAVAHTADVTAKQAKASVDIGLGQAVAQEHIRTVYRTIHDEVKVYVTPEIDRTFRLPVGLIRVHDAGVFGVPTAAISDPASQPDDRPSPITASQFGEAIVANYGSCTANAKQLTDLQAWVRKEAQISSVKTGE